MDIKDVSKYMNKIVLYQTERDRIEYILTACILRTKGEEFYYQAELKDKTANSIVTVPLEKVEVGN